MNDPKVARGEPTQMPICTLNIMLPQDVLSDRDSQSDLLSLDKDHSYLQHGISKLFVFYFVHIVNVTKTICQLMNICRIL